MAKASKKQLHEEGGLPETDAVPDIQAETDAPVEEADMAAVCESREDLSVLLEAERDKYVRLYAEYDNYRKRSQKEREALYQIVRAETISRLLPVYDNLERALRQECADEVFLKGIEMTMTQFSEILDGMGVTPVKAVGEVFDPTLHNAVFNVQDENYGEKIVIEETQKGFMIGDRVIRFASVVVAN